MKTKLFSILVILVLLVSVAAVATAAPAADEEPNLAGKKDDRLDPKTEEQRALHEMAMEAKLNGKALGKTHEVAKGQYVELERLGEDSVWTVMGEFNDFSHNSIAEPDRSVDNTTMWTED
ncbi:MAG: hypothetical protein KAS38_13170, partial [Anaerolineales bacterium]|nr:hypothetical protein [Anaerolineales bacterium]